MSTGQAQQRGGRARGARDRHGDPRQADSARDYRLLLRGLKDAAGFRSLRELAECVDIPPTTLSDALSPKGERLPPWSTVKKIVAACDDPERLPVWQSAWQRVRYEADAVPSHTDGLMGVGDSIPRQLPPDIIHFVGRYDLMARLDTIHTQRRSSAPPIVILEGEAGTGKTALALHWLHANIRRFPDGQLLVPMSGIRDKARNDDFASEGLALALWSLGVAANDVPTRRTSRQALYRSLTYGRRLALLLDDVGCNEDVEPFLTAGVSCSTFITSRYKQDELVARYDAMHLSVSHLLPEEARELATLLLSKSHDAGEMPLLVDLALAAGCRPDRIRAAAVGLGGHRRLRARTIDGRSAARGRTDERLVDLRSYEDPQPSAGGEADSSGTRRWPRSARIS